MVSGLYPVCRVPTLIPGFGNSGYTQSHYEYELLFCSSQTTARNSTTGNPYPDSSHPSHMALVLENGQAQVLPLAGAL